MQSVLKLFTEHPETVGESYFGHMAMAFGFGFTMIVNGIACLIHGIFPFLCVTTGSQAVTKLHDSMVEHRDRRPECMADTITQE